MNKCVICLEPIRPNILYKLKCSHQFHKKCILKWIKKSNTCPICRKKITVKKYKYTNLKKVYGDLIVMFYIFTITFFYTTFILKMNDKIVELNR